MSPINTCSGQSDDVIIKVREYGGEKKKVKRGDVKEKIQFESSYDENYLLETVNLGKKG